MQQVIFSSGVRGYSVGDVLCGMFCGDILCNLSFSVESCYHLLSYREILYGGVTG